MTCLSESFDQFLCLLFYFYGQFFQVNFQCCLFFFHIYSKIFTGSQILLIRITDNDEESSQQSVTYHNPELGKPTFSFFSYKQVDRYENYEEIRNEIIKKEVKIIYFSNCFATDSRKKAKVSYPMYKRNTFQTIYFYY